MFRDPFVWRSRTAGGWRSEPATAMAVQRSGCTRRRTCTNGPVSATSPACPGRKVDGPETGEAWECPQVLDLAGRSVAVVGTWSQVGGSEQRAVTCRRGADPAEPSSTTGRTSTPPRRCATASSVRCMFGWITEGREQARWREAGWAGALSLPRQVWLGADDTVRSAPVPTSRGYGSAPRHRRTAPHRCTMRDRCADGSWPWCGCISARPNISTWSSTPTRTA